MNLEQLQTEINKDLDDSLENEELLGWINRCMDDLSTHAKVQKNTVISVVNGQKEYELPSDLQSIVQIVDGVTIISRIQLQDYNSTGYKLWGNKLIVQPTPTEDKSLDLYYEAILPHLVNAADEPQIPTQFHDLFILYTVAKARYQDEEETLQMNVWQEYKKRKDEFISFMLESEQQEYIEDVFSI